MQLSRWTLALLSAVLAVALTAACGKTISEALDDTTITTRVKTALLNDPNVGGLRIDVDARGCRIGGRRAHSRAKLEFPGLTA